jgi:hypothetical protein
LIPLEDLKWGEESEY